MILYFNTKLINSPLINQQVAHDYFYPVVYPRKESVLSKCSPFDILIKTIKSYSVINFTTVIFNLEIDLDIPNYKEILSELINNNFTQSRIILKFYRPSTIHNWIADIKNYNEQINFNEPVFVVMNHDHPFVDYQVDSFKDIVSKVFTNENNFKKVFYYSHSPEVFSWSINGRGLIKFKNLSGNISVSSDVNNWIDSIGIMTFQTLLHIWEKAEFNGDYIGRIDWDGVEYKNMELALFVYPREFCKHYDGYNHITGLRLDNEIQSDSVLPYSIPSKDNINSLLEFYYSRWMDISFLMIRDFLLKRSTLFGVKKETFVKSIEISLESFFKVYLENDVKANLIEESLLPHLKLGLRNKVFYNANWIYGEMMTDVILKRPFTLKRMLFSKVRDFIYGFRKTKFRY